MHFSFEPAASLPDRYRVKARRTDPSSGSRCIYIGAKPEAKGFLIVDSVYSLPVSELVLASPI